MGELNQTFDDYLVSLETKWIRVILILGFTLVPLFGLLDFVMMPPDKLGLFWWLRAGVSFLCVLQYLLIWKFPPRSNLVVLHAYWFTFLVGGMIAYMTTHLGGFEAPYYAGLNLVLIAVNLFLPWNARQGALNGLIILVPYLALNLATDPSYRTESLINNLYFIGGTIVIAVTISHHKHILTHNEFNARTALWGEMEIARRIQTALLPGKTELPGYDITAAMIPASEVGGDYYDVIRPEEAGAGWICMGDVSGHGVSAGLIMMMAQTSVQSVLRREPGISPSRLLTEVNEVLRENISRLKEFKYLTIYALRLDGPTVTYAGKHQDLLIYRRRTGVVEEVRTTGFWLGIETRIGRAFQDERLKLEPGDVLLLFTDGITELSAAQGNMYGQQRLISLFARNAEQPDLSGAVQRMLQDFRAYDAEPDDDITLMLVRKT